MTQAEEDPGSPAAAMSELRAELERLKGTKQLDAWLAEREKELLAVEEQWSDKTEAERLEELQPIEARVDVIKKAVENDPPPTSTAWALYLAQLLLVIGVAGFYLGLHNRLPMTNVGELAHPEVVELAMALDGARDAVIFGAAMATQEAGGKKDEAKASEPADANAGGTVVADAPEPSAGEVRSTAPEPVELSVTQADVEVLPIDPMLALTAVGAISPSATILLEDAITVTTASTSTTGGSGTGAIAPTTDVLAAAPATSTTLATAPVSTGVAMARATVEAVATEVYSRGYVSRLDEGRGAVLATAVTSLVEQVNRPGGANVELVEWIVDDTIPRVQEPAEAGFFWSTGGRRYAEILFAIFFGYAAFAMMNRWKFLRHPHGAYWTAWHVSKTVSALVLGFAAILLLQQVNFVSRTGPVESPIGLGYARMEYVFAVSVIAGYFSNRLAKWLGKKADAWFGPDGGAEAPER